MSVLPISGSANLFLDLIGSKKTSTTSTEVALDTGSTSSLDGSADLSSAAKFFAKLQNLSQTDPAKFKQLTARIANELQTSYQAASDTSGSTSANLPTSTSDSTSSVLQSIFQQVESA